MNNSDVDSLGISGIATKMIMIVYTQSIMKNIIALSTIKSFSSFNKIINKNQGIIIKRISRYNVRFVNTKI